MNDLLKSDKTSSIQKNSDMAHTRRPGVCASRNSRRALSETAPPDPRVAFALIFVLSGFGAFVSDAGLMAAMLALTLVCSFAFGVKPTRLFRSLGRLWQAAAAVALIQSVFAPSGEILFKIGEIPVITTGGLLKGFVIFCKLSLFIVSGATISRYPQRALIQAMIQLRMPYDAAYMISIGAGFVPQMRQEFKDSLTALQLRGVVIKSFGLKKKFSIYFYLLLPAVAASLQNARELAMSVEMRAFRATGRRTSYYKLKFRKSDAVIVAGVLLLAISLVAATLYIKI